MIKASVICTLVIIGYGIRWLCKKYHIQITLFRLAVIWCVGAFFAFASIESNDILFFVGFTLMLISSCIWFYDIYLGQSIRPVSAGDKITSERNKKLMNRAMLIVLIISICGFIYLYFTMPP